jgi:hypothetical protein
MYFEMIEAQMQVIQMKMFVWMHMQVIQMEMFVWVQIVFQMDMVL